MRSRGEGATEVFTAETMAAKFGVVEGSYDAVPLPRLDAHIVRALLLAQQAKESLPDADTAESDTTPQ